ncbi:MAG: beta-L-arabinofuranosidase domain-containing protein [Candidatus Bipolaricaulia bacterium]
MNPECRLSVRTAAFVGVFGILLLGLFPAQAQPLVTDTTDRVKAQAFPLSHVQLRGGPFDEAQRRDVQYLLDLDPDRLLHNFRRFAGLKPKAPRYDGWESSELAGHTLGHYLSAISMYAATAQDDRMQERVDYIVDELARVQAANGDGYLNSIPGSRELFREIERGEITEAENFSLNGIWSPWYTIHKHFAGLLDAYWFADNEKALEVAKTYADWVYETTDDLTAAEWEHMLQTEYGGMSESMANLYEITGDERYRELSQDFHDQAVLGPLADREPILPGLHSNTQIPKAISAARRYQLLGADSLKTVATYFWERVINHHTFAPGGHGIDEYFSEPDSLADHLTTSTMETCSTYNMLRLTRYLFTLDPSARYMDYYERGLYNHILTSQEPKRGMMTYLTSLKPGHYLTYSTPTRSFWCCVGTGMENHVKYGDTIYFRDDGNGLYVNLFIPSTVDWPEKGLTVRQETRFPAAERTTLSLELEAPTEMPLRIRHPRWAEGFSVRVNGEPVEGTSQPGSYLTVQRRWTDGDEVEVRLPMELHVEALPDDARKVAVLYGPIVLGGALGTEDMPEGGAFAPDRSKFLDRPTPEVPKLRADPEHVTEWIEPVDGQPLTFETTDVGRPHNVTLRPFYQLNHQRYTIYWDLLTEAEWTRHQSTQETTSSE